MIDFTFNEAQINNNIKRLTNQLWKLIPMRENNENWREHINSLLIEFSGLQNLFNKNNNFIIIVSDLQGLLENEVDFVLYRKTVFDMIHLLNGGE